MSKLKILAFIVVALFVADLSSSLPADGSGLTSINTQYEGNLLDYSARKICCTSKLDRTDYAITPGLGAYKIHKRSVTWNEARKICVKEGAQLAVLDSARKLNLLRAWMNKESLETLWLGFHDIFEEGSWTTVTGELVDTIGYHPWATGEPNNWYNGMQGEHCAILSVHVMEAMGADDGHCDGKSPFVCEINLCTYQILPPVPLSK